MIAVEYRYENLQDGTAVQWVQRIRKNVTALPEGYEELLSQSDYDNFISTNQSSYDAFKAEQAALNQQAQAAQGFKRVREKWQELGDNFAVSNVSSGITTAEAAAIADSFDRVKYYLEANVPMKALEELAIVPADVNYFTEEVKTNMYNELLTFIQETFSISE